MIFAGASPRLPKGLGCSLTARMAWIAPAGRAAGNRASPAHRSDPRHSGLPGARRDRVCAVSGPRAGRARRGARAAGRAGSLHADQVATVGRAQPGAASPVPAGWTWAGSGPVRFATPPSWNLQRARRWATCGTGLVAGTLLRIDAIRPPLALPCPYRIPTASAGEAQPGLVVVTGKYAAQSVGQHYDRCQSRRGVRVCLSSVTGQGGLLSGVLIFSVSGPHNAVTYFLLGLSGSRTARTIFRSISASTTASLPGPAG